MKKGIFCLEGLWHEDLRYRSTVRPVLELLSLNSDIPYIHSDCATKEELEFYLSLWLKAEYDAYPILYLAFHGVSEGILLYNQPYLLDEMAVLMAEKCRNRIFLFASCNTIRTDLRNLKRFLKITNALALGGYRKEVPWLKATAFELLVLSEMQENALDGRGISAVQNRIKKMTDTFKELDFLLVTAKEL